MHSPGRPSEVRYRGEIHGDPATPRPKGHSLPHQFDYCGQTAGWIKMALGTEMGLCPRHIALDPAPLPKSPPPNFGPFLLWPNGWIHQDATWHGGRPWPRRLCIRRGPRSPPQKKRHSLQFRPISIVAKRLLYVSVYRLVRR